MNLGAYFLFSINKKNMMPEEAQHIVFYDGVCGLCHRSVRWLIRHDRKRRLRYAALQSELSRSLLRPQGLDLSSGTIVFSDQGRIYLKSEAIIRILQRIKGRYHPAGCLLWIPVRWRDGIYDWVAQNRYRWFGKYDTCPLPDEKTRDLFLDQSQAP